MRPVRPVAGAYVASARPLLITGTCGCASFVLQQVEGMSTEEVARAA